MADDPLAADVIASNVRGAGYETFESLDGANAIALARRETPDLIVLDIHSDTSKAPWDGYRIMDWLRRLRASRQVPIIIVTDNAENFDVERAVDSGTCGILYEPLDHSELLRLVHNALEVTVTMAA